MGLIDNEGVVLAQELIILNFSQQYAISHQLNKALARTLIGEAHLITHRIAQRSF